MRLDFFEAVERAEAGADKGWLGVIAADLEGSRASWEELPRFDAKDIEANLALANLYERE